MRKPHKFAGNATIEFYIGDDLYAMDVYGDHEEIQTPNFVMIWREQTFGDSDVQDVVTFDTCEMEWRTANDSATPAEFEEYLHGMMMESLEDAWEASRESAMGL